MEVQPDFRDLFALMNKHQVDHLIVGAYALTCHGAPRYTGDIDICVRPRAWDEAESTRESGEFGDVPVHHIGRDQYVANKRAAG